MKRNYFVLRRHCKDCGKEFKPEKAGRICSKCKYKRQKASKQKWLQKNRERDRANSKKWSKLNVEKNREKARRHLWRKKLKFLISQRIPGQAVVRRERAIAALQEKLGFQHS